MPTNGHRPRETQIALEIACDALAYLTIVATTVHVGAPGAEYAPAFLHLNDFVARAEHQLAAIDPSVPLELRTKIRENAAQLQQAMENKKARDL
jgi:hypothetical protein